MTVNAAPKAVTLVPSPSGALISSAPDGNVEWQLPQGHFVPQKIAPVLIFPRPDSETVAWAKHRRHYPGIRYEIPIGVAFGSWPFYFELVQAPLGMVIGKFLTASGDKLVVDEDYGVVRWDDPQPGTYPITVRVSFQDGTAPMLIQWTLEVTTTGTIFMDAANGLDTNDGSFNSPLQTIDGWYKQSEADRTFSGMQVCYRAGTYAITTADTATNNNVRLTLFNKPLVHYAYGDEAVTWNFVNNFNTGISGGTGSGGEYQFSDWFLGGITCSGGPQVSNGRRWFLSGDASAPISYDGTGGAVRCTFFKSPQIDWDYAGADTGNNAGVLFGSAAGTGRRRHYWLWDRCDLENIFASVAPSPNFVGVYIGNTTNMLFQNFTVDGACAFGHAPITGKSSELYSCYRNIDASKYEGGGWELAAGGSYEPGYGGGVEFSYVKMLRTSSSSASVCMLTNKDFSTYSGLPNEKECYSFRNSLSRPASNGAAWRRGGNWPSYCYRDVWHSPADGWYLAPPTNDQSDGEWVLFAVASSPFDVDLNLVGDARVNYLGTHGAEIA